MKARIVLALAAGIALVAPGAGTASAGTDGPRLERLDRGLVAATTADGVFLSWRLLGDEATGRGAKGLTGTDFDVHRDGRKIARVTDSTNFLDPAGLPTSTYRVTPVRGGRSGTAKPWAAGSTNLPLKKPADGVTPAGEAYTYSANDISVGDVDGDGSYEYVVKWDPSNSKDVSQVGYTGPVYLDVYKLDGRILYRVDLGVNVRAGAHYTQFLVYDFDGDNRAELMFKTAPGTKIVKYGHDGQVTSEKYISLPKEDVRAGVKHTDDYRLSAAGYYEHVVRMFRGWSTHPEVLAGRWPATLEAAWNIEPRWAYPLSDADARAAADHFIDVYAPSRSARNQLRNFAGFIVDGPEYLTVLAGDSGRELETIRYEPGRHDDGLMWGDYAMARIEPANRVDRFLSGVAYLDGKHPAAIFARGYYTRTTVHTYTWNGRNLKKVWGIDSGWVPMTNPFNDGPHGRDGTDPVYGRLTTQGAHSLSVADVDADGRQEIIYGAATIDDDGSVLYSSFAVLPPGSADPGVSARLGHGDAMHVTDIDPNRPGLEVYMVHEGGTGAPYGHAMRDARTGEVLFGTYSGVDTGRGMVGDILPEEPGLEAWATTGMGLWSADGRKLGTTIPGTNQSIRWAGDMTTQIVDGALEVTPSINDWKRGRLVTLDGTRTNNGTKGNPGLVADIFGDWREELLIRTADSTAIQIHMSTELTDRKLYTLMHDWQYRVEVARQQTTYNQPSYTSFYLASDIDWQRVPLPRNR